MPLAPRRATRPFKTASDPLAVMGRMRIMGAFIDRQTNKGYVRVMKPSGSFLTALGKSAQQEVAVGRYEIDELIAGERSLIHAHGASRGLAGVMNNNFRVDRTRDSLPEPETSLIDFIAHCITLINAKGDELGKPQPKK